MNEEVKERAKQLYIYGKKISDISKELRVSEKTIYSWANRNEWDEAKRVSNLSPNELKNILSYSVKAAVLEIKDNPEKILTPGIADTIIKYLSALKKLDKDIDYLGVASDVMETITKTIREEYPEHLEVWQKMARRIYERIEEGAR